VSRCKLPRPYTLPWSGPGSWQGAQQHVGSQAGTMRAHECGVFVSVNEPVLVRLHACLCVLACKAGPPLTLVGPTKRLGRRVSRSRLGGGMGDDMGGLGILSFARAALVICARFFLSFLTDQEHTHALPVKIHHALAVPPLSRLGTRECSSL